MTGLSLADEIRSACPQSEIMFFATSRSFEKRSIIGNGFLYKRLKFTGGRRNSILGRLVFFAGILADTMYCAIVIKRFRPDVVVGLGGFSSVPSVLAALLFFFPFVLIDQNLIPGKVNRFFARWAKEVFCHFDGSVRWFGRARSVAVTGNPIRKEILSAERDAAARYFGMPLDKKTILIVGGSQGARAINETMVNCLWEFEKHSRSLQVIHCTGENDFEEVKRIYEQYSVGAYVCPFLDKMEFAYSMADVIVSRAGAGTITEITAIGLPAVLVPYPSAADNHQYYNALELADHDAGCLIEQKDFTPDEASALIMKLLTDKKLYDDMKRKSRRMGKPEAAGLIFDRIRELRFASKN